MRPEYIDAVDAVRHGYTAWLPFLPALLIWYAAIRRKRGVLVFFIAWSCSWFLLVSHSNAIQAAKDRHAQTDEEWADWASDTWNTFAPVTAVPYTLLYCLTHALVAYSLIGGGRFVYGLVRRRNASPAQPEPDYEAYRASLVREHNSHGGNE